MIANFLLAVFSAVAATMCLVTAFECARVDEWPGAWICTVLAVINVPVCIYNVILFVGV